jgi:ferredoxin-fold anticodon binding domain-containing protein
MEKEIVNRFTGKRIAFKKVGSENTFIGELLEVTNYSILIRFHGRMQSHLLEHITVIEECVEKDEGSNGK